MSTGLTPPKSGNREKSGNWLDNYTAQLQKEDKDLNAELEKYKKQFNNFHEATKVANERAVAALKKTMDEKQMKLEEAEKNGKVWRKEMEKATNKASELSKKLEDLQKNDNSNDDKNNKLQEELKAANADLAKAQDKANEHEKIIAQAKKTLDDEIKRNKALLDAMKQANKSLVEKFPKQK